MKYLALVGAFFLSSCLAFAEDSDSLLGNGGGVWMCASENNPDHGQVSVASVHWLRFVDLYEAEAELNLVVAKPIGTTEAEVAAGILSNRLKPLSQTLYNLVLNEFENVKKNLVFVDSELVVINDSLYKTQPSAAECKNGQVSYVQLANYTTYGKILVQKNIFESTHFGLNDKAALYLHEAIYALLRKQYGDTNSVRARNLTGYLFSTLTHEQLKARFKEVLGNYEIVPMWFVPIKADVFEFRPEHKTVISVSQNYTLRDVTIPVDEFEIQATEVTQKQYYDVMGSNPSRFRKKEHCPDSYIYVSKKVSLCPNHPVESMTWLNIEEFLVKLNKLRNDGYQYRLPTDPEWQVAAKRSLEKIRVSSAESSWYVWSSENSSNQTHPVASLGSYDNNLYDMYGNVAEWSFDWYSPTYLRSDIKRVRVVMNASEQVKSITGGGFNDEASEISDRSYGTTGIRFYDAGFRLARNKQK